MARASMTFRELQDFELAGRFLGLVGRGLEGSMALSFDGESVSLLWTRPNNQSVLKRVQIATLRHHRDILGQLARRIRMDLRDCVKEQTEGAAV